MLKKVAPIVVAVSVMFAAAGCSQSDPGITTAVKGKLAADDTVKAYQIDVDTKEGVVTLTGTVETGAAKDQAVRLARETDGVTSVADNLTVNPSATVGARTEEAGRDAADAAKDAGRDAADALKDAGGALKEAGRDAADATTDAGVTAAVKTKLLADTTVGGLKIDVDTNNGVVTLTGTVRSAAERQRAIAVAKDTAGVKNVVDKLVVG